MEKRHTLFFVESFVRNHRMTRPTHSMKDSHDILAVLLAADDHPHLREEATYREAKALLDESAELQRDYEEARTFFDKHPVLVGIRPMPEDVRDRIQ